MSGALGVIAAALVLGIPVVGKLDPSMGWRARVGAGLLVGLLAVALLLFLGSLAGLRWTPLGIAIGVAALAVAAHACGSLLPSSRPLRATPLSAAIDVVALLLIAGYAVRATAAEPWEWDFWAIWGLKGRVFFEHGAVDADWLADRDHGFAHPGYPPLLPLLYAAAATLTGAWDASGYGAFTVAFGVGLWLFLREALGRWLPSPAVAALAGVTLVLPSLSQFIGLGDGAVAAYGTAALVILAWGDAQERRDEHPVVPNALEPRAALRTPRAFSLAAILLGGAAFAKNEGLTLIVACGAALAMARVPARLVVRLWPALGIAAVWLLYRLAHRFPAPLLEEGGFAIGERLAAVPSLLFEFLPPGKRLWLLAIVAAIAIAGRARLRPHRVLLAAAAIQLLFYVGAYLVTPWDVRWHVEFSWPRLLGHLAPALAFVAAIVLAQIVASGVEVLVRLEEARRGARPAGPPRRE